MPLIGGGGGGGGGDHFHFQVFQASQSLLEPCLFIFFFLLNYHQSHPCSSCLKIDMRYKASQHGYKNE